MGAVSGDGLVYGEVDRWMYRERLEGGFRERGREKDRCM